jgi:hypothetical protein
LSAARLNLSRHPATSQTLGLQVDLGFNKAALLGMIAINVLD